MELNFTGFLTAVSIYVLDPINIRDIFNNLDHSV